MSWVLERVVRRDSTRVCVAGDSVGVTLALGLSLVVARDGEQREEAINGLQQQQLRAEQPAQRAEKTRLRHLFRAPGCILVLPENRNVPSGDLEADTLRK